MLVLSSPFTCSEIQTDFQIAHKALLAKLQDGNQQAAFCFDDMSTQRSVRLKVLLIVFLLFLQGRRVCGQASSVAAHDIGKIVRHGILQRLSGLCHFYLRICELCSLMQGIHSNLHISFIECLEAELH
jgi:hypothetical protein